MLHLLLQIARNEYIIRELACHESVLADHVGNTGLRILASSFSIYARGVR